MRSSGWFAVLIAMAAAQVQAESKPIAAAPASKPKMVCYSEPATGSHIRKRTCVTEAQYEERRKRDQEAMMRTKARPTVPPPASGAPR